MKHKRVRKAYILANTVGTIGYLFLVTAWVLFVAVIAVLFMQSSSLSSSPIVVSGSQSAASEAAAGPHLVAYSIAVIVAIVAIVIFFTLPYFIAKLSSRFLRHMLKTMRIKVSKRSFFFVKCITASVPLLGFAIVAFLTDPTDMTIPAVHIAAIIVSVLAMVCFLLQTYLARLLAISTADIW